jgi:hypothetical protein
VEVKDEVKDDEVIDDDVILEIMGGFRGDVMGGDGISQQDILSLLFVDFNFSFHF